MYIGIATSKSSALSINTLLIFEMQLVNDKMFLNAKDLFLMSIKPLFLMLINPFVKAISPLTTIHASLKSHKSDRSFDVLKLICLLGLLRLWVKRVLPWKIRFWDIWILKSGPLYKLFQNCYFPNVLLFVMTLILTVTN